MASEARAARQTAQTPERAAARRLIVYGLAIALIVAVNWLVYGNAVRPTLFRADDLAQIELVRAHGPFSGFGGPTFDSLYLADIYYRPIFTLQMWVMYRLFGLNYTGYQAVILAIHVLGAIALIFALVRLGVNIPTAAIAAAFYSVHPYVSEHVMWISDSAVITRLIMMLILIVLPHHRENWKWYAGLGVLLFLAPISRETGLAIVGGAFVYAVAAYALGHLDRRAAAIVAALCVASVAAYFTLRAVGTGALVRSVPVENSSILRTEYTAEQIAAFSPGQRRTLYAYTVIAYLTGPFFPIYTDAGALRHYYLAHVVVAALALTVLCVPLWLARRVSWKKKAIIIGVLANLMLLAGFAFVVPSIREALHVPYLWLLGLAPSVVGALGAAFNFAVGYFYASILFPFEMIELDPIMLMTFGIIYAALFSRKWSAEHKSAALLGLGIIAAVAVMAFPYFRLRTLGISLIGWLLLFALAVTNLRAGGFQRAVGALMLIMMVTATVRNGIWVRGRVPPEHLRPASFTAASELCSADVSDELVFEATARFTGIDPAALAACREANREP
jgi:hypothetical protein